jgi:hypothetical protein
MRKSFGICIMALAATLASCSHGTNSTLPASGNNTGTNPASAFTQKMARELQRVPSTFVAPKHPGYLPDAGAPVNMPSGISEAGQLPVPGGMFDIVNQYNTTENGQLVTVYAGSRKDTGAGMLLVVRRSPDLHTASAYTYVVAPSAVRIESASQGQLQLQTVNGPHTQSIPFRMPL